MCVCVCVCVCVCSIHVHVCIQSLTEEEEFIVELQPVSEEYSGKSVNCSQISSCKYPMCIVHIHVHV